MTIKKQISPISKVIEFVKVQFFKILSVIGMGIIIYYLSFIPKLRTEFPKVQDQLKVFMDEQVKINVNHNTRIYKLEIKLRDDSIKKSTYQQIRSKPNIRLDELKRIN
jgi:hypothetical protein